MHVLMLPAQGRRVCRASRKTQYLRDCRKVMTVAVRPRPFSSASSISRPCAHFFLSQLTACKHCTCYSTTCAYTLQMPRQHMLNHRVLSQYILVMSCRSPHSKHAQQHAVAEVALLTGCCNRKSVGCQADARSTRVTAANEHQALPIQKSLP